ncbi:hypothetical protein HZY93_01535 [Streptococcus danieliae]|uniref:Class IIb bacteriocin, lactobin A/cerein 7B family n=1 Tax=Streptococcus danieliae TaxID=747656 RepID=A0A7Z0RQ88_9STRE|nr:hypothetical protein [Streptococcus danieliae]MBF0716735.1 hypothetical protein [Streptococcus danieliae]NYS48665.1 hypothetical protein [Streptococcus danieliae]
MKQELKPSELQAFQGGVVNPFVVGAALITVPFVFGAIAGAADEYSRKHGHS